MKVSLLIYSLIPELFQLRTTKYSDCSAVRAVTAPEVRAAAGIRLGHSTWDTVTLY